MVQLPSEKSGIDLRYSKVKVGVIGASGIGKSQFFAGDDKALFIEAEAGLNYIDCMKIPARSWADLIDIYASLVQLSQKEGEFPYSIVILDTIDRVVGFAEQDVISHAKEFYKKMADDINTIGDIPNGGGWSKTTQKVMNLLNKFEELPCAVGFIGHLKTKRIEQGSRKYDKDTICLWAGVGESVLAWADHILHVQASMVGEELRRVVYTKPTQSREAKSRGGIVPDGWSWKSAMGENYKNFRGLFT